MSSKSKRKLAGENTRAASPESADVSRRPSVFERLGPGAPGIQSQSTERSTGERTEKCRNWLRTGSCCYGSSCRYQHGPFNSPSHLSKKERERNEKDLRHKVRSKKEEESAKEVQKQRSASPSPKQKEQKQVAQRTRKGDHDGKIKSTVVVTRLRSPASDQTEREKPQTGSWEDDSDDWPLDVSQLDYKEELTLERKRQQLQRELAELEIQKERMLSEHESVIITKTVSLDDSSSSQSQSCTSTTSSGSSGSSSSSDDSDDDNSSSVSTSSQSQMQKKSKKSLRDHEPIKPLARKISSKDSDVQSNAAKLPLPKESTVYMHLSPPHDRKSKKRSKEGKDQASITPEWKGSHPDETSKSSVKSRGPHTPSPPRSKSEKASSSNREPVEENWKNKRHKRKHESSPQSDLGSHLAPVAPSGSPQRHHRAEIPLMSSRKEKDREKPKKNSRESDGGKTKKKAKEISPLHAPAAEKQSHSSSKHESSKKGHSSPYHKRDSDTKRDQSSHSSGGHSKKSSEYKETSKYKERASRETSSKKSKNSTEKDRSSYRRSSFSPSHKKVDSIESIPSHRSLSPMDHAPIGKGEKRKRSASPREKDLREKSKDLKRSFVESSKSRDDGNARSLSPAGGEPEHQGSMRKSRKNEDSYSRQEYSDDRRDNSRSKHEREKDTRSDRSGRNSDGKVSGRRQETKSVEGKHSSGEKNKGESRNSRDAREMQGNQRSLPDRRDRSRDEREVQRKREREKDVRKSSPHRKASSPTGDQSWPENVSSYKGGSRRGYAERRKGDRERDREAENRRESSVPHHPSTQDVPRSQPSESSRESRGKDSSHHRDSSRRRDGRQHGSDKKGHKDREVSQRDISPSSKVDDNILLKEKAVSPKRSSSRENQHEKTHSKERSRSHHSRSAKESTPPHPPPPLLPLLPPPLPPKRVREPSPSSSSGAWDNTSHRTSMQVEPEPKQEQPRSDKRPREEEKTEGVDVDIEEKPPEPIPEEKITLLIPEEVEEHPADDVITPEFQVELEAKTDPVSPVSENSSVPASPALDSQGTVPLSPVSNIEEEKVKEEEAVEPKDILSGAEEFSDWSDDDDDLLTREEIPEEDCKKWDEPEKENKEPVMFDQTLPGSPIKREAPNKDTFTFNTPDKNANKPLEESAPTEEFLPSVEREDYRYDAEQEEHDQGQEFEDDLGEFDPISDDELEALIEEPDEGKAKDEEQRVGIVDALDVDWSQLMSEPKPLPKFVPGSARKLFTPTSVLSRIGFSKTLAGETLSRLIISECEKQLRQESAAANENRPEQAEFSDSSNRNTKFVLEHPIAAFHAAIVKRRREREGIVGSVGPYRKALCARQDLKIRQFLCRPHNKIFDASTASTTVPPQPHPVDKALYKLSLQYFQQKQSDPTAQAAASVQVC